jgi:GNAT superfamily N-acetyltransferase
MGGAWIALADGRRVGCLLCVRSDEHTAQLRILLVERSAGGHRLGGRLVDECLAFARRAGYARMKPWTNDPQVAAWQIYVSRGFTLLREEPHHSFGADLLGQVYEWTSARLPTGQSRL